MNIFKITGRLYRIVHINTTRLIDMSRMFHCKNKNILILGLIPVIPTVSAQNKSNTEVKNYNSSNSNNNISKEESKSDKQVFDEEKTPWERVKAIFEIDEYGCYSKELTTTLHCCYMAMFIGMIYGGVQRSRYAFVDFMERNQASIFENHLDAKRRLQNHVTIHFGKGGFFWAWRFTAFTGGFVLTFLSLHAYRGTTSFMDYAISGAIVGALMRIKLGPPGIIIGGVLGGILGFLGGISNESVLSLFGTSYDEVLSLQYKVERDRSLIMEELQAKNVEESGVIPKPLFERLKTRESDIEDRK